MKRGMEGGRRGVERRERGRESRVEPSEGGGEGRGSQEREKVKGL
jgi:hypothetical protein